MGAFKSAADALLAPAFVAALVTFLLNTRDERLRTSRDFHTKFIEGTREDIRSAVTAGVAYFTSSDSSKLAELEAQVLLYESEIRSNMVAIRSACTSRDLAAFPNIHTFEAPFLAALTGGSFGTSKRKADPAQARRIVGQASIFRSDLAKLRRHQLERARLGIRLPRAAGVMILLLTLTAISFSAGLFAKSIFGWP